MMTFLVNGWAFISGVAFGAVGMLVLVAAVSVYRTDKRQ